MIRYVLKAVVGKRLLEHETFPLAGTAKHWLAAYRKSPYAVHSEFRLFRREIDRKTKAILSESEVDIDSVAYENGPQYAQSTPSARALHTGWMGKKRHKVYCGAGTQFLRTRNS